MAHGTTSQDTHEAEGHHGAHGTGRYHVVLGALLLGTVLTIWTGKTDFGAFNIVLAMIIATTKAALVVWFFMHMSESTGINRLVFFVSVLFVLVLFIGVFGDLMTRNPISLPGGGPAPYVEMSESPGHAAPHAPTHH